ncbi:hypothetical protein BC629DRAFT_1440963 [Irpex lacteus]|nr:hypothetical protein BC629DRAFT_1440963 [Irpex lacteus]
MHIVTRRKHHQPFRLEPSCARCPRGLIPAHWRTSLLFIGPGTVRLVGISAVYVSQGGEKRHGNIAAGTGRIRSKFLTMDDLAQFAHVRYRNLGGFWLATDMVLQYMYVGLLPSLSHTCIGTFKYSQVYEVQSNCMDAATRNESREQWLKNHLLTKEVLTLGDWEDHTNSIAHYRTGPACASRSDIQPSTS